MKSLWNYRHFILSSAKAEIKARFVRSRFGGLWMVLQPLALVLIYALVLSQIMRAKLPGIDNQYAYSIYLLAGIVCWTVFSEILGRLLTLYIEQGNLLKKVAFPKLALPAVAITVSLFNAVVMLAVMYGVFALLGHAPFAEILWLIPLLGLTVALAAGLGLSLGILNVFIRDIGQIMQIVLQFWFWLTPIVYTLQIIPPRYHFLFYLNPLTGIVEGYQSVLVYDRAPELSGLIYPSAVTLLCIGLAAWVFRHGADEMVDQL